MTWTNDITSGGGGNAVEGERGKPSGVAVNKQLIIVLTLATAVPVLPIHVYADK